MATWTRAFVPSTHGLSSNANSTSTLPLAVQRRKHECAYVGSSKRGSVRNYINDFTTLMFEISDMFDKDSLFYFQDGLRDWPRGNLIDVAYKRSMMPSPLQNHLSITLPSPKIKGLAMVKVRERAGRTRAITGRSGGRKSLQTARAYKVNRRSNNRPSLKAYASYPMAPFGSATVRKRSYSML